jgi:hypothetical protein
MSEGVDGLLRDRTRPGRLAPLSGKIVSSIVSMTLEKPRGETNHWTAPAMAKAVGINVFSVQRVWHSRGPQQHRIRQFKPSDDKRLAKKILQTLSASGRLVASRQSQLCRVSSLNNGVDQV